MDPFRLIVQKRLTAALQEITPANGYQNDFSEAVFRGRSFFGDSDPIPMLSILETPIPDDQLPSPPGFNKGPYTLMVQGFVADDRENPTDPAHIAMADVKQRLGIEAKKQDARKPEDAILGTNLVVSMDIGPGVVRPPDEISAKAYFWLTLELELVEDQTDPYGS